jgi:hypothetical protein
VGTWFLASGERRQTEVFSKNEAGGKRKATPCPALALGESAQGSSKPPPASRTIHAQVMATG